LVLWLSAADATAEIATARSNEHAITVLFIPVSLQFHGTTISHAGSTRVRASYSHAALPVDEQARGNTGAGEGVRMRHGP
jgi:hypothetical protein